MKNRIIVICAYAFMVASVCASCVKSGAAAGPTPYMDKARESFRMVWNMYRVPQYGLFSEYYPQDHRPNLTYFNDGMHKPQEVSYIWPMSGVFSSAALLACVDPQAYRPYLDSTTMAVEMYYDDVRIPAGYQAYPRAFGNVDRYYDDNGLVGVYYTEAYKATGDETCLEKGKQIMTFILSGWNFDFDGAVWWVEGTHDQKPACTNGKAMITALKLYEATGDEYYLTLGQRFYDWIRKYLQDDERGVICNSWSTISASPDTYAYTYNTGTMIQGAVRLYHATGKQEYLDNARKLAEGSHKWFFKYTEQGTPYIEDLPWFNVVLFRGYHELFEVDKDPRYVDTMIASLDYAWENARDNVGLVYYDWTGRADEKNKPKWLLDEACIPEFFTRAAMIRGEIDTVL